MGCAVLFALRNEKTILDIAMQLWHGSLCVSMSVNAHECAWVSNAHACAWVFNVHECWVCMSAHNECAWKRISVHYCAWVSMNVVLSREGQGHGSHGRGKAKAGPGPQGKTKKQVLEKVCDFFLDFWKVVWLLLGTKEVTRNSVWLRLVDSKNHKQV